MNALEIIVAVCLGVGPWAAATIIGFILATLYEEFRISRQSWKRFNKPYGDDVSTRVNIILTFWYSVGLVLGAFASGCYVQKFLDLFSLLS